LADQKKKEVAAKVVAAKAAIDKVRVAKEDIVEFETSTSQRTEE